MQIKNPEGAACQAGRGRKGCPAAEQSGAQVHRHRRRASADHRDASFFYWRSTFTEDTDDAQVDGNLYQVSSRVTGQVIKVYVEDNQTVQAGAPIAEIDPKDYQVALDQAEANLANAQAEYTQATVNVPITVRTSVGTFPVEDLRLAACAQLRGVEVQAEKQARAA